MNNLKYKHLINFLFEIGTLRKIPRAHMHNLITNDLSDNISSHSFRVAWIGWNLAELEGANNYKTLLMCLLHDIGETRSGDQNWIHKRYVKVFDNEIAKDQLMNLPENTLLANILYEYEERVSLEANLAKDADVLEQLLLLKEHAQIGNTEANRWLQGEIFEQQCTKLFSRHSKAIAKEITKSSANEWWEKVSTPNRRN